MSIELPAVGQVHPAASGEPYLAVSLTLDPAVLATLLADLPKPVGQYEKDAGFSVASVTPELMDAWVRMLRLMNRPEDIAALAPVYEREILRSEEHTSELQSLMRISYAVFCLKKKTN